MSVSLEQRLTPVQTLALNCPPEPYATVWVGINSSQVTKGRDKTCERLHTHQWLSTNIVGAVKTALFCRERQQFICYSCKEINISESSAKLVKVRTGTAVFVFVSVGDVEHDKRPCTTIRWLITAGDQPVVKPTNNNARANPMSTFVP